MPTTDDGAFEVTDTARGEVKQRVERFRDWTHRLSVELAALPDTLQRLREGSVNFELVGQRLADATTSLEDMTALYQSTIAESASRSAEAAGALRAQIEALAAAGSPERLNSTLADVQQTIASLAELNPLWPRPSKRSPDAD